MLLSVAEFEKSGLPTDEVRQFFASRPLPPVDWDNITQFRETMEAVSAANDATLPPARDVLDFPITIAMRDGYQSVAKVRKPALAVAQGGPLIVLAFGGGFIAGSNEQMAREARALVRLFGAVVVNISYRLAPEYKFPVSVQDGWDNLVWLAAHAQELGADPAKGFIMGGVSAGASLAAVCARRAQVEPLAQTLTGQWLDAPSLMQEEQVPERWKHFYLAHESNKDDPVLPEIAIDAMHRHSGWDMRSSWRSPLGSSYALTGLSKTYIQAHGTDILRDDALLYDEMLKEAGVDSRCDLYNGCPHAHTAFLMGTEAAKKGLLDLMVNMGWMLDRPVSREGALKALNLA